MGKTIVVLLTAAAVMVLVNLLLGNQQTTSSAASPVTPPGWNPADWAAYQQLLAALSQQKTPASSSGQWFPGVSTVPSARGPH